ncbi:MAG: hypothetical protein AAFZ15_22555 [Bacteroidota bacterium]
MEKLIKLFPLFLLSIFLMFSCNKDDENYSDDMYLYLGYDLENDFFDVCENVLELNLDFKCETYEQTRFAGSKLINSDDSYQFNVYFGDEASWNSIPNFSLTLYNIGEILGTHLLEEGSLIHNYDVTSSGAVVGMGSESGDVTFRYLNNKTYRYNNAEYRILSGTINATMNLNGASKNLSGVFQLPLRI